MDREKDNINKDKLLDFVPLKLEKLSKALYLVSNPLNDSDPLKWRLKDKALSLLSETKSAKLFMGQFVGQIDELLSLIDIARLDQRASQMNFDILRQEYLAIRNRLETETKLDLANKLAISEPISLSREIISPSVGGRRETILKWLKQNGPTSIKDISHSMPNVSSKTVQRELNELIKLGLLRREGERRWSRYSLV